MRYVRSISILLTLALALAIATPALAATVPTLDQLSTSATVGGGTRTLIVSGTLPSAVPLPAKVVLAVPKGATPNWVGEIVGTDPSADPTAKYEIASGKAYDTITITVTKSRTGQAEFTVPSTADASGELGIKVLGKTNSVQLQFWVPKGSTVASSSAGLSLQTSTDEYDIYAVTRTAPKTGSTVKASIAITGASAGSGAGSTASPSTGGQGSTGQVGGSGAQNLSSLIGLMLVIVVAGAAGFFGVSGLMTMRERRAVVDGPVAAVSGPPSKGSSTRTRSTEAEGRASSSKPAPASSASSTVSASGKPSAGRSGSSATARKAKDETASRPSSRSRKRPESDETSYFDD